MGHDVKIGPKVLIFIGITLVAILGISFALMRRQSEREALGRTSHLVEPDYHHGGRLMNDQTAEYVSRLCDLMWQRYEHREALAEKDFGDKLFVDTNRSVFRRGRMRLRRQRGEAPDIARNHLATVWIRHLWDINPPLVGLSRYQVGHLNGIGGLIAQQLKVACRPKPYIIRRAFDPQWAGPTQCGVCGHQIVAIAWTRVECPGHDVGINRSVLLIEVQSNSV